MVVPGQRRDTLAGGMPPRLDIHICRVWPPVRFGVAFLGGSSRPWTGSAVGNGPIASAVARHPLSIRRSADRSSGSGFRGTVAQGAMRPAAGSPADRLGGGPFRSARGQEIGRRGRLSGLGRHDAAGVVGPGNGVILLVGGMSHSPISISPACGRPGGLG